MNDSVRKLWAKTKLKVWPEQYALVGLPPKTIPELNIPRGFFAMIRERDEVSITVPTKSGPYRVITFDLDLDPEVCGYFAPAAEALAAAGVPIVPQCGFLKDHILVRKHDLKTAVRALEALISTCRRASPRARRASSASRP